MESHLLLHVNGFRHVLVNWKSNKEQDRIVIHLKIKQ